MERDGLFVDGVCRQDTVAVDAQVTAVGNGHIMCPFGRCLAVHIRINFLIIVFVSEINIRPVRVAMFGIVSHAKPETAAVAVFAKDVSAAVVLPTTPAVHTVAKVLYHPYGNG